MSRHSPLLIMLMALAGWTCSQQPVPSKLQDAGLPDGGDGGLADAGPDAGTDAGLDCGNPLTPSGADCGTLGWTTSPVTSRLRNHQISFVAESAGPFLYVLGGVNGTSGFLANADMAPINADGSLGAFSSTTPLTVAAAGAMGGLVGNVFVIAGGHSPTVVTDQSFSSVIQTDGSLGPWNSTGSILHPRMHGGAVIVGSTIYVMGGFDGDTQLWNDVVSASVNADGTLSTWSPAGTLPEQLSHFSTALVGNHVYLAGGLNRSALENPPELKSVVEGTVQADGTLGAWVELTPLPVGLATHASFVYGGQLYVAGGINDIPDEENRVWSTPIASDGTLGAWTLEAPLPIKRAHVHQLPRFENHFYSIAGAIDLSLDSTSEIDIGAFE